MNPPRMCIFPKDVQLITGRSERYGRQLLADIKCYLGKQPHQFVTVREFAVYCGLPYEEVVSFLD